MAFCPQCGTQLAAEARFCGACGTHLAPAQQPQPPPAAAMPAPQFAAQPSPQVAQPNAAKAAMKSTMLGVAAFSPAPAPTPAPVPVAAPVPEPAPQSYRPQPQAPQGHASTKRLANQTMIGVGALPIPTAHQQAGPPSAGPPLSAGSTMLGLAPVNQGQSAQTPAPPMAYQPAPNDPALQTRAANKRTMIGMAMPGIAPVSPAHNQANAGAIPGAQSAEGNARSSLKRTMLGMVGPTGVASPSNQPTGSAPPGQDVEYVEETYDEVVEETGRVEKRVRLVAKPPPPITRRPWFLALCAAATLALAAVAVWALLPKAAPVVAEPRLDSNGKEVLHLTCASCPDGTKIMIQGGLATEVKSQEIDVSLPAPLHVGANDFTLVVDRPGSGRDENIPISVPLSYRIWPDVSALQDATPTIRVMVEAIAGSTVSVQGQPVSLDANGKGTARIEVGDVLLGASDETKAFDRTIPYSIAPTGAKPVTGSLTITHQTIVPLLLDSPGQATAIEGGTLVVSGKSTKGATITIGSASVVADVEGRFSSKLDIANVGTQEVFIRASSPPHAPRMVKTAVRRVASLSAEAKEYESKALNAYSAAKPDLANSGSSLIAWKGEIVELAARTGASVAVMQITTGCPKAPCIARVQIPNAPALKTGDKLRIYGRLIKGPTTQETWLPTVEADFVLRP